VWRLLTMSDGRDFVARDLTGYCREAEDGTSSARRLGASQPELTIFHYPVWAFPHFTMLAASAASGPLLLLGSELQAACTFLGISFEPLGSPG
jgi:L-fucose/D-arabinose isomerase